MDKGLGLGFFNTAGTQTVKKVEMGSGGGGVHESCVTFPFQSQISGIPAGGLWTWCPTSTPGLGWSRSTLSWGQMDIHLAGLPMASLDPKVIFWEPGPNQECLN